jgi:toxin-antitoxin system PIN domain toxin
VLIPDVDVFVYAARSDVGRHQEFREWLESTLSGTESVGVSESVLASVIRITTNRRIFCRPSTLDEILEFTGAVLDAPSAVALRPGPRHWELFTTLCRAGGAKGDLVPDAFLSALAIESGATLVTADQGMRRWPGVRVRHPFDPG